jgi:hypothetical protein
MTAGPELALRVICPFENVLRTGLLIVEIIACRYGMTAVT